MTWVQILSTLALIYLVSALIAGCVAEANARDFWNGVKGAVIATTTVLFGVILGMLAFGWLPK